MSEMENLDFVFYFLKLHAVEIEHDLYKIRKTLVGPELKWLLYTNSVPYVHKGDWYYIATDLS